MLFEECRDAGQFQCNCNRLQNLVHKSRIATIIPPGILKEQGAVIFEQTKHSFNHNIYLERQSKEKSLYSQENSPLVVQTHHPTLLFCTPSTDESNSPSPSLGSGTTANDFPKPESEISKGNIHTTPGTVYSKVQTLKRSREESEHPLTHNRVGPRHCADPQPEQEHMQHYPKKRTETTITLLAANNLIAPHHYTARKRDSMQPHGLNRKSKLRFDENVPTEAVSPVHEGGQKLAEVHPHILQGTS